MHVDYVIDTGLADAWCITKTHVAVETDSTLIPQRKSNPIPGKFEFTDTHDCVTGFGYTIPNIWNVDDVLAIAAHANVEVPGGLDALELALPATADLTVAFPGGDSYFNSTVTNGGVLNGTSDGWCVDTSRGISPGTTYNVNVFSSYSAGGAAVVDKPENLDLVNWIINQDYVGTAAPVGNYTYGDVQRAIWALIENTQSTAGLGLWTQANVDQILAEAAPNDGFEPGCNERVAVILQPVAIDGTTTDAQITIAQVTFVSVGVPCEARTETAWADGFDFDGKNWATWFEYTIQD